MDPLTHALLGAAVAQTAFSRQLGRRAGLIGAVSALLPDADVLIRSSTDPLLAIEYHRGFTHSLLFIPVGGFIAALPWLLRRSHREDWKPVPGAATLGYATHAVLDSLTTYGTQLFWPFSSYRVALNWISIIDPIFTLALLIGVALAAYRASFRPAAAALVFCLAYLGLGAVQRERALGAQERIAASRGNVRVRGEVFPTIGNNLVWRSLYLAGDSLHADRIRIPWLGPAHWVPGTAVRRVRETDLSPAARGDPRVVRDFRRFAWFSDGWVARAPADSTVLGDARYSLVTDAFQPVWGVRFHPDNPERPTEWVNRTRDRDLRLDALWAEITGRGMFTSRSSTAPGWKGELPASPSGWPVFPDTSSPGALRRRLPSPAWPTR